jgi:hypothetical protein
MKNTVCKLVPSPSKNLLLNTPIQSSITKLTPNILAPITGANQNSVATGLSNPIPLFFRRTWVSAHRSPPAAEAERTRRNPPRAKADSVATMRSTPPKMRVMTATRRREKDSSLKAKAKMRTKMREEDLTMAGRESVACVSMGVGGVCAGLRGRRWESGDIL